jgi:prepilin-type processing-associated H-X9-DG protein/prepilin-type N-terminal cleavage/methylation domain-containing protein
MSKVRFANRGSRGFTLVELLVVIGIIAVLISILLPALSRAKKASAKIKCASNIRQFFMADEVYVQDYKGWHLPGYWGPGNSGSGPTNPYNKCWAGIDEFRQGTDQPISSSTTLNCYVLQKWYCPIAARGLTTYYDPTTGMTVVPINYSYGMNVEGVDTGANLDTTLAPYANGDTGTPGDLGANALHAYKDSAVRRPAVKLMFTDASWNLVNETGSGVSPGWQGQISNYDQTGDRVSSGAYNPERTTAWRHDGTANVCFFDGHVESLRKDQIYNVDVNGNITGNDTLWKVMVDK